MKRTIIAIALAAVAATAFAASENSYRNSAGEQDKVQLQLGDASSYRNSAGDQDQHQPQVG
jgi:uncharacterized protein YdeI (BOF family)